MARQVLSVGFVLLVAITLGSGRPTANDAKLADISSGFTIASDPADAEVYIDGRFAGKTPLSLGAVTNGDHRVRLVKQGYLENSRVVSVQAGRPQSVDVKLTKHSAETAAAGQVSGGGGGGGSKKWLWIGVAGGGAAATTAYFLANKNSPPTAGAITVSPSGSGMAGITPFALSASASDPDGDSLTYSWTFGDGSTGTGATQTKVYGATGTFSVGLTVSDGKKSATAPAASIAVGQSLVAIWTGGRENYFGCGVNVSLNQSGTSLTGTMLFASGCSGQIPGVTGSVSALTHPATVTWQAPSYSFTSGESTYPNQVMSFSGTTNTAGTTITGSLRLRQIPGTFDQSYPVTYSR